MFGIGMSEMIIICVVALLVFGPDELPQIVKKIARGIGEARKVTDDLRRSIDLVDEEEEDRRARTFARSQPALHHAPPPAGALDQPEVIPGSALTPAHGDDAPVIAAPVGAVAVGAADDRDDERDDERDDVAPRAAIDAGAPPTSKSTTAPASTTADGGAHGADATVGEPSPAAGR